MRAALLLTLLLAAGAIVARPSPAWGAPFQRGDVFLTGTGVVREFSPSAQLVQDVPNTSGANVLCFDPSGQHLILPGAGFGLYDSSGNVLPSQWSSVTNASDCVADQSDNVYVSSGGGTTWRITKYDLQGNALHTFDLPALFGVSPLGIDLGPDGCTIYYGAWSDVWGIGRLNVCTGAPGASFSTLSSVDHLRILPSGGAIVTQDYGYRLLDASGTTVRTYGPNYSMSVPSLALDPDGRSFWIATGPGQSKTPVVLRFDINSGQLLSQWGLTGPIAVYPGSTSPAPASSTSPSASANPPSSAVHTPNSPISLSSSRGAAASGANVASPAQIRALLSPIAVPRGKTAAIKALLSHGGYSFTWSAPTAGRLTISWYRLSTSARPSRLGAPILVATLSRSFSRSATAKVTLALTSQGEQLLKSLRRVTLTSKASFSPRWAVSATTTATRFTLTR